MPILVNNPNKNGYGRRNGKNILLVGEPMGFLIAQEEALLEDVHLVAASAGNGERTTSNVAQQYYERKSTEKCPTKTGRAFFCSIVRKQPYIRIGEENLSYQKANVTPIPAPKLLISIFCTFRLLAKKLDEMVNQYDFTQD